MREIKFRAWDKKGKQMYKVSLRDILEHRAELIMNCDDDVTAVMQYTGLLSKSGKEIYEGDIISGVYNRYPQNWQVDDLSVFGLTFTRLTRKPLSSPYFYRDMRHRDLWEVIGNIYENKELLEK